MRLNVKGLTDKLYALKDLLRFKRGAYRRVFDARSFDVETVMRDLDKYCRGHETTMHPDSRSHAVLEGRRQVLLRIMYYSKLSEDRLWEIYDGRKVNADA